MRSTILRLLLSLIRAALVVTRRRLRVRREPRLRWRMEVLSEFLRGDLERVIHDPVRLRKLELRTPLPLSVRRRVRLGRATVGGVDALWITPAGWTDGPTVLYLHGGGYTVCSPQTHRALAALIARAAGARCLLPAYRLAPEHPHPAVIDDAVAVYRALLADGVDPGQLVVAGDSAGGGLTLAALAVLRDHGEPLPRTAVLLSPWVDLACRGESIDRYAECDYVPRAALEAFARNYLGGAAPETPSASPLYADLSGLPPLLIQLGAAEILLSEGRQLAERARAADVGVTLQVWDGAVHVFQALAPLVPEASAAIRDIGKFVRQACV